MALIAGTNITTNQLETSYSPVSVAELRRQTVLGMIVDRTWDGAGTSQDSVRIRVPDAWSDNVEQVTITGSASNRAQADRDWGTGQGITAAQVILQQDLEVRHIRQAGRLDIRQSPINELEKMRQEIVGELNRHKEQTLANYIAGLTTRSTSLPVAADYPNADATAANGNAGKPYGKTFGVAGTDFIKPDGEPSTDKAKKLVAELLEDAHLQFRVTDYQRNGGLTSMGRMSKAIYAFMHPVIARVLVRGLRDEGIYLESINATTRGFDDSGPRVNGSMDYEGTYAGLHIITTTLPSLRAPTDGSKPWPVWVMSNEAIAWTDGPILTQVLTPQTNQNGPTWQLRQIQEYGYQLVQKEAIQVLGVHSK